MGNQVGTKRSAPEVSSNRGGFTAQAAKRFTRDELNTLRTTFDGLVERSHSKEHILDKTTFLKLFNLPGMLGERLFYVFGNGHHIVTWDDFLCGLAVFLRGPAEEKIRVVFRMYDFNENGLVGPEEMILMLRSSLGSLPANSLDDYKKDYALDDMVLGLGDLGIWEFGEWIYRYPQVLVMIEDVFLATGIDLESGTGYESESEGSARSPNPSVTSSTSLLGSPADLTLSISPRRRSVPSPIDIPSNNPLACSGCGLVLTYCGTCGSATATCSCPQTVFCVKCGLSLTQGFTSISTPRRKRSQNSLFEPNHSGYLYKYGKRLSVGLMKGYYVIRGGFLYALKNKGSSITKEVIFLEGCFVEPVSGSTKLGGKEFGFAITVSSHEEIVRLYYCSLKDERDAWVSAIRNESQVYYFEESYSLGLEIGTGKFSKVHSCIHSSSDRKYAVKILDKRAMTDDDRESLRNEIAVLQLVSHPSVIKMWNVFESKNKIHIVMDFIAGGDLYRRIRRERKLDEYSTRKIIRTLLEVTLVLNEFGIVHRDLKPENILVVSSRMIDEVLIADFGLSRFAAPEEVMTLGCGTLAYVAPEVLLKLGYDKKVDIWSIGAIMYVCLTGNLPFEADTQQAMVDAVLHSEISYDGLVWASVSTECSSMIKGLLEREPSLRFSVDEALQHPWFQVELPEPVQTRRDRKSKSLVKSNQGVEMLSHLESLAEETGLCEHGVPRTLRVKSVPMADTSRSRYAKDNPNERAVSNIKE